MNNASSTRSRSARRLSIFATMVFVAGASAGVNATSPLRPSAPNRPAPAAPGGWRVMTMEHVDLWLHGFALLTSDTGRVPFFARGYKIEMSSLKRQRNVFTQLDANQSELSARFGTNPALANAQFVAMYFTSFQEITHATDLLIRSGGNPRASADPEMQREIYLLAQNFPTAADRNWLRLFVSSLEDENSRFYHTYWMAEQQTRSAGLSTFEDLWTATYYPKLVRFLNNTQQAGGQLVLSLPMGGEGRTINDGKLSNTIAVEYPRTAGAAPEALFAFVHEAIAKLAEESIQDNSTPAQVRSGAAAGYTGNGAVRGGALLLQHVAPELVADYMRYYLKTMNATPPTGDPSALFAASFPLPDAIVSAINKQIDSVLGGI